MKLDCVVCGKETGIGEGYALPFLVYRNGSLVNLYACSPDCRAEWREARGQVKEIQAALSAQERTEGN